MPVTSIKDIFDISTHILKWISNLTRANAERQKQSRKAVNTVTLALRKTTIYFREIRDTGKRSISKESELTELWTSLSFNLEELHLENLSKKCNELGKYWTDPFPGGFNKFKKLLKKDTEVFDRIKKRFDDIENLARKAIKELRKSWFQNFIAWLKSIFKRKKKKK